jgi:geranylgeranyl diphosphate synthase type I
MIGKKTAALLGASVQAGAILATDDQDVVEAYRRFGYHLGLAFQMADDVKGTFWASAASGKPEAGDVRKHKKTMPLVWAFEHASETDAARLREIYAAAEDGEPMPPEQITEVLDILDRCGAAEHAAAEARRHRDAALADVASLPIPEERRRELRRVVESIIAA